MICVDNGSTDNSLSILRSFEKSDSRIRVLEAPNGGASTARNRGLNAAAGKYLAILDSDDIFRREMLEVAYYYCAARHADVCLFGSDQYIEAEGCYKSAAWTLKALQIPGKDCFTPQDIKPNAFRSIIGWTWDKLFSRQYIASHDIRFQELPAYNDMLFTYSSVLQAERITFCDKVLVHQRKRGGGSISDGASNKWRSLYDALAETRGMMQDRRIYQRFERDFINYVVWMVVYQASVCSNDDLRRFISDVNSRWLLDFGIVGKPDSYFYSPSELGKLRMIMSDFGED